MTSEHCVLLIGGGGHAAVVAEAAIARGWRVAGFLDDDPETEAAGAQVGITRLGAIDDLSNVTRSLGPDVIVHAATGDADLRRRWLRAAAGARTDAIVHPSAVVSPSARLGEGSFIGPCAVVNARAVIGRGAIVNSGAIVEHDVSIGDFAHIAPGGVLAGAARVGDGALIGCGAAVLPGVSIGRAATLGAGSVANRDVPGGVTAAGVPARAIGAPANV